MIEAKRMLERIQVGHCVTKTRWSDGGDAVEGEFTPTLENRGIKFELHANGNYLVGVVRLTDGEVLNDGNEPWVMAQHRELTQ